MSLFAWLDHSDEHRQRMMEVVGLFREKGTVDELGIGSVRDTLSEILFPGTSTLHTRARYLLFLPWICLGMERDRVRSRDAGDRFRRDEIRLIYALDAGGEDEGVIGIEAKDNLKQLPSQMYWSALGRHGIRLVPASRRQYLHSLDGFYLRKSRQETDDEGTPLGDGVARNWHAGLPEAPEDFLEETTLDLTIEEADYLTERILDECQGTYLAHLVTHGDADIEADFPWMHPAVETAPDAVRDSVRHGRIFSEVMHGAAMLYNLILAERVRDARTAGGEFEIDEDLVDHYRGRLADWVDLMEERRAPHLAWHGDRPAFWQLVTRENPRVPRRTVAFVNRWSDLAVTSPDEIADDPDARHLVEQRELQVKRSLARVRNLRALERWSGASGTSRLNYRWSQVSTVASDIVEGRLAQEEVAGAGA